MSAPACLAYFEPLIYQSFTTRSVKGGQVKSLEAGVTFEYSNGRIRRDLQPLQPTPRRRFNAPHLSSPSAPSLPLYRPLMTTRGSCGIRSQYRLAWT